MAQLEVRANKKFKILEDYDKRKQSLEDHAVKMVLERSAPNANLPMIPSINSAVVRQNCGWCATSFWGVQSWSLCEGCTQQQQLQSKLNLELNALRREVSMATAQAAVSQLAELKQQNASPAKILAAFKDNAAVQEVDW